MTQQTNFPHMPPCYWPILDAYLAYVRMFTRDENFHPRKNLGSSMRQSWYHGAFALYNELNAQKVPESEHASFVQWACRYMERNNLTNKSPKSLIFLVDRWGPNKNLIRAYGEAVEFEDEPMVICDKCEKLVYTDRVEEGLCLDCRTLLGWEESYMKASV